jgi:peptidoglycan hydrolase CwlO-like protein
MSKFLVYIIIGLSVLSLALGIFVYTEHTNRVKAEQQVATLTLTTQNLQDYMKQKDKAYNDLNKKYQELKGKKPNDLCGDSPVSEEILEWLRNR